MTEDELLQALRDGLSTEPSASRPAGVEVRQDLVPAGGLPIWPPSYEGRLEIHARYVDPGEPARNVIELDSVGSAANRLEDALLELHGGKRYPLPVSSTTVEPSNGEPRTITTLEAPHRLADAWIRLSDGDADGTPFERTAHGEEIALAHMAALDVVLETSAHDLLFGVWDSHRKGPHGQLRIPRALTTSLIGLDPIRQAQFAARRDPLNLGEASDLPKGSAKLSEQGLSSIPPQKQTPWVEGDDPKLRDRDSQRGGVAITSARYLGYLFLPALRRLGFTRYDAVEARVLLATLALYALTLRDAAGWDLRARCSLVAQDELRFTLVLPKGERREFLLSTEAAERLFCTAVERVGITDRSVELHAGKKLNDLVERSITASLKND